MEALPLSWTNLLSGIVLYTKDAAVPRLSRPAAKLIASLDNTQERQLRAAKPLTRRAANRTLPAVLGGEMKNYVWTINGAAYPHRNSLDVRSGERVDIDLTNHTSMAHPMHLHGHDFEVLKVDGEHIAGALRDTVVVPPGLQNYPSAFEADNAGIWAFHCHLIYHLVTGHVYGREICRCRRSILAAGKASFRTQDSVEPLTSPIP